MKTIGIAAAVLMLLLGCSKSNDRDRSGIPCGQTCFDCAGLDTPRTYDGEFPPAVCSPSIKDMMMDDICYRSTDDPADHGAPWCFYNCGVGPECVRPTQ